MNPVQPFETTLQEIVTHLIIDYTPTGTILFDSFARGDAHRDSDIDLLIIKETDARDSSIAPFLTISRRWGTQ